jgi:hypothetical protein
MPAEKNPEGARGAPFSPMSPRKKEEEGKEEGPKVVPIGRFLSREDHRRLKEQADQPGDAPDQGGQPDPAAEEEEEEGKE